MRSAAAPAKHPTRPGIEDRVEGLDWQQISTDLNAQGWALMNDLFGPDECDAIAQLYSDETVFRSRIVMARHGFGQGEYKYFGYPLPEVVAKLRTAIYPHLVPIANAWHEGMGMEARFPNEHAAFVARCHDAGQTRPTPLLLKYGKGDYNALHQDLYGEHVFPLQVATLLSEPSAEFSGGEFVLTEQRPRMQSRASVVPLAKGDGVV